MLIDEALIDYEYLKDSLKISSDSNQEQYEELINASSLIANRIVQRSLKATDRTLYLDGNESNIILLKEYPVNSISELNVDDSRLFSTNTIINSTDYGLYKNEGIIKLYNSSFPSGLHNIKIICNTGFTTIPNDIKTAIVEIVSFLHRRQNNKTIGQKTINTSEGISETWETSIPLNALDILFRYK